MAATVDLMVSRLGPTQSTSNYNGTIGPIRDTITSTVAAKGMTSMIRKVLRILELETFPWTPTNVKSVSSPLKDRFF